MSDIFIVETESKILMDFSPKAGCTYAITMFLDHFGKLEEAVKYRRPGDDRLWIHNYREDVWNQIHIPDSAIAYTESDWKKFKVVRYPLLRIVSSYYHVLNVLNTEFADHRPDFPEQLEMRTADKELDISFYDFIRDWWPNVDDEFYTTNPYDHVAPQFNGRDYEYILKAEYLDLGTQILNQTWGTNFKTTSSLVVNSSRLGKYEKYYGNTTYSKLPRPLPNYASLFNEETINLVKNFFYKDFKLYNDAI